MGGINSLETSVLKHLTQRKMEEFSSTAAEAYDDAYETLILNLKKAFYTSLNCVFVKETRSLWKML